MLRSRAAPRGASRAPGWSAPHPCAGAGRRPPHRGPVPDTHCRKWDREKDPFPVPAGRFRVVRRVPLEAAGRELRGGRRFPSSSSFISSSSSSSSWCRSWPRRAVPGERGRAGRGVRAGRGGRGARGCCAGGAPAEVSSSDSVGLSPAPSPNKTKRKVPLAENSRWFCCCLWIPNLGEHRRVPGVKLLEFYEPALKSRSVFLLASFPPRGCVLTRLGMCGIAFPRQRQHTVIDDHFLPSLVGQTRCPVKYFIHGCFETSRSFWAS